MASELVSIVIPTYNRKNTIRKAIESCLSQSYADIEIVICDDQSTDGTLQYLEGEYGNNAKIVLCSTRNYGKGANAARNVAIHHATGEYIAFLDSDDYLTENSIQTRLEKLNSENADFVYGEVYVRDGVCRQIDRYADITIENVKQYIFEELSLCIFSSVMVRRKTLETVLPLDETLPAWQDDDLVIQMLMKGKPAKCKEVTAVIGQSKGSISRKSNNNYLGLKLLIKKYRKEIVRYASLRRLWLWKIRLLAIKLRVCSEQTSNPVLKILYSYYSKEIYEKISGNFRRMFV
jgi:glycosyltransferase involved in cell wall biosynthesis